MICCLNPDCPDPLNPDGIKSCMSCGTDLVWLLRGRYRILQPLGGGGFARTYLAEDVDKLDEQCVVKQLAPQTQGSWSRKKVIELFQQEAKRLQQLGEHPQIPTLYAYFKEDDYLYLVQQFIQGHNLLQELKFQGVFDETRIRSLLLDLLPVLATVHQQQVIHRDIKPENIIRRQRDGRLVLIDFGVSKQKTGTIHTKGTNIGSFGYAPLEQMHKGEAYPSSDLYCLGVTCFHLMTNVSPWELWMNQGYSWTYSWRQHLLQPISDELDYVLNRLLQVKHEMRYQSAVEVLQDLDDDLPSQSAKSFQTIVAPNQPLALPPQLQQQPIQHTPSSSAKALLPRGVLTSSGSSLLAIALVSFIGTLWISSGLWLLMLGGFIFAQSQSLFEKTYLFIIAILSTAFIFFLYKNLQIVNPLQTGINGLFIIVLLVILAGLLAFILITLSRLLNQFVSKYF
jgi:serine/threonine protein kinase